MAMTYLETLIESIETFRKGIAEWILLKDCVDNPKFIEYLDTECTRLNVYLNQIEDAGNKGIDHSELQHAKDRLAEIDGFKAIAMQEKPDNGMSKNDCKVAILKAFLWVCCHWNDNKLKHIKKHVKDDTEDAVSDRLNHIRNGIASIHEAMELLNDAEEELGKADIAVSDYSYNQIHMDVELGFGIDDLASELDMETNGTSLMYGKIRFLEVEL